MRKNLNLYVCYPIHVYVCTYMHVYTTTCTLHIQFD